jgi:exopolyphosphatase / guanosine-5'-triphosphate,3'-diphosphate pyrophosphatase
VRLGAIDIGSNAARLLISEVTEEKDGTVSFNKLNLIRVPLRLGMDVFDTGEISAHRLSMILETMKAYRHLLNVYEVKHLKACATSAMRDAKNSDEVLRLVHDATGIQIEVITGDAEANYIYENHVAEHMDVAHSYLYIDVGGGSTELTLFNNGKLVFKESFDIGTIRLLQNKVKTETWEHMKVTLTEDIKGLTNIIAIGSGGNINKIHSLSKSKEDKPLTLELLRQYYTDLEGMTVQERILKYKLREDRADVIVHALQIYINVMRWAGINEIYVPKIGLADGLIQHLYQEIMNSTDH